MRLLLPAVSAVSAGLWAAHWAQAANYTWAVLNSGNASGSWAVSTNWSPNVPTLTTSADTVWFTGLDITVDSVITLDGPQTIGRHFPAFPDQAMVFGDADPSSAASWTINATAGTPSDNTNILTLDADPAANNIYEIIRVGQLGAGKVVTINARLTNNSEGGLSLAKGGEGTLVLTADNSTLTGAMAVNQGVLVLDFSQPWSPTNNILGDNGIAGDPGSSHLQLQGAELRLKGKASASNSQSFTNGTSLELGASKLSFDQNGASSLSLNLGTMSRNAGGVMDVSLPASGSVTWAPGASGGAYPAVAIGTAVGTNGLLVDVNGSAYATVNDGSDWAADNSGNIVAASSIGGFYTPSTSSSLAGNADLVTNTNLTASASISSLRAADSTARTIDVGGNTLSTGGILVTGGAGTVTIQNGNLNATSTAAGGDLIIHHYGSNPLNISANIVDAPGGATVLTKTGSGTVVVSGYNTYTGNTIINDGVLSVVGGTLGTTAAGAPETNIEIAPAYGDSATMIVSGGTVNGDRILMGGNSGNFAGGRGTLIQTGGTINSGQWFSVGGQGHGTFIMSGGVLNQNAIGGTQMEVGVFGNGQGTIIISGNAQINLLNNANLVMGVFDNAGGVITQNGGTVTFYSDNGTTPGGTGALTIGQSGGAGGAGVATYNLNGGVLSVNRITHSGQGTGVFNFNGGTIRATQNNAILMTGLTAARVQAGGAIIDTGSVTLARLRQPLVHDPALGSTPDGGLTKNGGGTLRLEGISSYTGPTIINGGTLQLLNNTTPPLPVGNYTFNYALDTGGGTVTLGSLGQGYTIPNTGTGGSGMNGTVNHTDHLLDPINGGAALTTGRFGNGLSLDGLGSSVDVLSQIVDQSGGGVWTLSVWVKTNQPGSAFVGKNQGGNGWDVGYSTFYLGPSQLPDPEGDGTLGPYPTAVRFAGGFLQSNVPVADDNWHMLTFLNNGSVKQIYVDGTLTTLTYTGYDNPDTSTFVRLGYNIDTLSNLDGNTHFFGVLDEVKFYNVALTAAQIQQLYNNNNITIAGGSAQYLPQNTAVNITAAGAALDLNANSQIIGSLAGVAGSNVYLTTGTLTTGGNNTSTTYAGVISGSGGLVKTGTGTFTISGNNTYTGGTTVNAGALITATNFSNGTLTITGGLARVAAKGSPNSPGGTTKVPALNITGGQLDLTNNSMIIDYTGSSPIGSVQQWLLSGYNGGAWNGNGIITSLGTSALGLGYAEASDLGVSSFGGQPVDSTAVLIKFTYMGDSDLDGDVDNADFGTFFSHFQQTGQTWFTGDFDYDGDVDNSDFGLFFATFNSPPLPSEPLVLGAAVPEPGALGLIGVGLAGLVLRRRRS